MKKLIGVTTVIILGAYIFLPMIFDKLNHKDIPTKGTDFILGEMKGDFPFKDVNITELPQGKCDREIYEVEYRCVEDTCTFNIKFN